MQSRAKVLHFATICSVYAKTLLGTLGRLFGTGFRVSKLVLWRCGRCLEPLGFECCNANADQLPRIFCLARAEHARASVGRSSRFDKNSIFLQTAIGVFKIGLRLGEGHIIFCSRELGSVGDQSTTRALDLVVVFVCSSSC